MWMLRRAYQSMRATASTLGNLGSASSACGTATARAAHWTTTSLPLDDWIRMRERPSRPRRAHGCWCWRDASSRSTLLRLSQPRDGRTCSSPGMLWHRALPKGCEAAASTILFQAHATPLSVTRRIWELRTVRACQKALTRAPNLACSTLPHRLCRSPRRIQDR